MFVCAYMWAQTYYNARDVVRQLVEFILSFFYMGFRDQIQAVRFGSRNLYASEPS